MFDEPVSEIRNTDVKIMKLVQLGFVETAREIINKREYKRRLYELGFD